MQHNDDITLPDGEKFELAFWWRLFELWCGGLILGHRIALRFERGAWAVVLDGKQLPLSREEARELLVQAILAVVMRPTTTVAGVIAERLVDREEAEGSGSAPEAN